MTQPKDSRPPKGSVERRRSTADLQIQELIRVGVALSHERDSATLLELILDAARRLTNADAGTLYVTDKTAQVLQFKILQNETLGTRINAVRDSGVTIPPPVQLYIDGAPNSANVSSSVALNGKTINIPDVYQAEGFNFSGVKAYDVASGYHSKSMLVVPLRDHEDEIIGVIQLLNAKDPGSRETIPFSDNDAVLVTSLASQAAVAMTQKRLIEQLSEAYVKTELSNVEMKSALQAVSTVRRVGILFAFCLLGIGGVVYSLQSGWSLKAALDKSTAAQQAYSAKGRPITAVPVEQRRMTTSVALTGQVEPITQMNVVSPFAGKVLEKSFEFGRAVTAGEVLVKLDTTDLEVQLRDATAAFIREQERVNELKNWTSNREVTQARITESRAKTSLATAKRKLEETKVLFEKGIVSKLDLDAAVEAVENQAMGLRSAQEDLQSALKKGDANAMKIAEMSLRNVKTRVDELTQRVALAEIRSPADGIVIMPVGTDDMRGKRAIEKGVTVEQGTVLFAIGNLDGFRVRSMVEESNIAKLKIGQIVSVSEDAYPDTIFSGKVAHISSQASGGGQYGQAATFEVVTNVETISSETRHLIRVGLSATLQVTAYDQPKALVVPLSAVVTLENGSFVMRRDPVSGAFTRKAIVPGVATLDVVEVLDGLSPEDQVAANPGDLSQS